MGQRLGALIERDPAMHVCARVDQDGLSLSEIGAEGVEVVIDFSVTSTNRLPMYPF